jgi:hypothetical protein
MSKNNKNAKRIAARKEMSKLRLSGGSGPARTAAKHGKKNAWWQRFPSYGAFVRGGKKASRMQDVETASE